MLQRAQGERTPRIAALALIGGQAPSDAHGASALLRERLESRRAEIEAAVQSRVFSLEDPSQVGDPTYTEGLRESVAAGIEYAFEAIFVSGREAPIPPVLLAQARHAARSGVSLDTVLRRYFAGYALLSDFVIDDAEVSEKPGALPLRSLMRRQARNFDRLLVAVTEAYRDAAEELLRSAEQRRTELVKRLLAGEMVDTAGLAYEFEANHVAVITMGTGAAQALRELATKLECRLLLVRPGENTLWAWLGHRSPIASRDILGAAQKNWPEGAVLALGEQGWGIEGWRHSHRQALATLPIARRQGALAYAEVSLLASMLQDEVLTRSLRDLYLEPLNTRSSEGETLLQTLRAYFASERNVSSAAAALCVTRKTVMSRLRAVEERIDRPLSSCAGELEASLRLEEIE